MQISVFGLGYVGAVTMACLAKLGHRLVGIDVDNEKVEAIDRGETPVSEPGLLELLQEGIRNGSIIATSSVSQAVENSELAIISVGTPPTDSGGINDSFLLTVVEQILDVLKNENKNRSFTIVVRSTCLPDVHSKLQGLIDAARESCQARLDYVCHPEFLREGSAIADFNEPPNIVFGIASENSRTMCESIYPGIDAPTFFVSVGVASMVKYAGNCFHATKVTFANEIGMLCDAVSVNSQEVMDIFCSDTKLNISTYYLRPGAPFGGSCLPKDLQATLDLGRRSAVQTPMLTGVATSNIHQVDRIVKMILSAGYRNVGINGLAFKENTDDLRESPAVAITEQLIGKGLTLRIFDSYLSVDALIGSNRSFALRSIPHLSTLLSANLREVFEQSDVLLNFHQIPPDDWGEFQTNGMAEKVIDISNRLEHARGIYW